jgi:hypothetical protein
MNIELMTHPLLRHVAQDALPLTTEFTEPTTILTDDKAPVEQIVHGLMLSWFVGE